MSVCKDSAPWCLAQTLSDDVEVFVEDFEGTFKSIGGLVQYFKFVIIDWIAIVLRLLPINLNIETASTCVSCSESGHSFRAISSLNGKDVGPFSISVHVSCSDSEFIASAGSCVVVDEFDA